MSKSERYLAWYSGLLTLAFAVVVLTGASAARSDKFDQIDVQRINVREPDGTLRFVVSSEARFPGLLMKGKEYPHPRGVAGMIFYNDEGTENGGMVFDGSKDKDGKVRASGHLSFDQYEQDQVLALAQQEEDGKHVAGLTIIDRPGRSLEPLVAEIMRLQALPESERNKGMAKLDPGHVAKRLFIGKNAERASLLDLKDANGKSRLRLQVAANGEATIQFLDVDGKVQRTLTPDSLAAK